MKTVHVFCNIFRDGDVFVAHCPQFDVSSYGETPEEAAEMFREAFTLYLDHARDTGTLEQIVEEAMAKGRPEVREMEFEVA